nr:immunoglobulin heavy chain junction region [Macaca mulatta]
CTTEEDYNFWSGYYTGW